MNPVTSVVLSVALLVGAAGGVYAYDSAAHSGTSHPVAAAATATPTVQPTRPRRDHRRTVVRWAPCPDGTELEDGVCVADVVRTVTLPAPAAPAVSHSNNTAGTSQHSNDGDDEGEDDEGGDRGDDDGGGEHDD